MASPSTAAGLGQFTGCPQTLSLGLFEEGQEGVHGSEVRGGSVGSQACQALAILPLAALLPHSQSLWADCHLQVVGAFLLHSLDP